MAHIQGCSTTVSDNSNMFFIFRNSVHRQSLKRSRASRRPLRAKTLYERRCSLVYARPPGEIRVRELISRSRILSRPALVPFQKYSRAASLRLAVVERNLVRPRIAPEPLRGWLRAGECGPGRRGGREESVSSIKCNDTDLKAVVKSAAPKHVRERDARAKRGCRKARVGGGGWGAGRPFHERPPLGLVSHGLCAFAFSEKVYLMMKIPYGL
ncbi:hypothetical protein EVAR_65953_1 [Eumeta japonica]|uniref:Uncharacterized protein n=1 Tax=Eumeta variegata TaxID=151549 RepID=A0A4C1ZNI7_EUMVA|nr:hypothetical protein EVAR_65953_1 [Eumeta japonica]